MDIERRREICAYAVEKLRPRVATFEEADAQVREVQCSIFEHEDEDYISAARALAGINMESGSRQISPQEKGEHYVRVADLYIAGDDTVMAVIFSVVRLSYFYGLLCNITGRFYQPSETVR